MTTVAERYHDISCGHRVVGHESKCAFLHGHNYRIHFTVRGDLDAVGRVLDFSIIKERLCMWVEEYWDHKFLAWDRDEALKLIESLAEESGHAERNTILSSIVWVPFNPTAERMAHYLLDVVGPAQLQGTGARLVKVRIEETRKCLAEVSL